MVDPLVVRQHKDNQVLFIHHYGIKIKMHGATWRGNENNQINAWKAEEQPNRNIGRQRNWIRRGIHADWWNLRAFDCESPHYLWPFGWAGGMQFVSSEKLFLLIRGSWAYESSGPKYVRYVMLLLFEREQKSILSRHITSGPLGGLRACNLWVVKI